MMTALQNLAADLLRDGKAVLVGGDGPAFALAAAPAPRRAVLAPGPLSRAQVGAGVAASGQPTVTLVDEDTVVDDLCAWVGPHVMIARKVRVAQQAWAAGVEVALPAWPSDLPALLQRGLSSRVPLVVLLHDAGVLDNAAPPPPPMGATRVLAEGTTGTVAAGGALATALPAIARILAGRGVPVTAVSLDVVVAGSLPDPATLAGHVLVGGTGRSPSEAGWLVDLAPVPVSPDDVRGFVDAVAANLRIPTA